MPLLGRLSIRFVSSPVGQQWRLVTACSALMAVSSGGWYTGSLFFVEIVREFGSDYASTAGIFSLFIVLYGAWNIVVGRVVDRFGSRRAVIAGGLLLPLALAGSGSAHGVWQLYVTHGVLTSLGLSAMSYVPVSVILSRRFARGGGLGLAFGIASAGVGIGIFVLVPLAQLVIAQWGWRVGYRCLAAMAALAVLPIGLFDLERSPGYGAEVDAEPAVAALPLGRDFRSAVLSRDFWLVAAALALFNAPIGFVMTHQVAHLAEAGHPAIVAAGIIGLIGLLSVPGKIGWGFLSDRFWIELIYTAGSSCVAGAVLILLRVEAGSSMAWLYAYAALIASGYAVGASMNPILCGRFFAGRNFGVLLGILSTSYHGGAASGVWLAGYAHDLLGSYRVPLAGAILSAAAAAACVWLAAPRRAGLLRGREKA